MELHEEETSAESAAPQTPMREELPRAVVIPAGCKFKVQDGVPAYNGLCYHVPTGDNKVLNS